MQFSFTIAESRIDDLPHLITIEFEAGLLLRGHLSEEILSETMPLVTLQEAHAKNHLLVARLDDLADDQLLEARRPVGFAMIETLGPSHAHLAEIDVHPSYGRRGIGTALVKSVIAWAGSHGFKRLTLTTFQNVPWNCPFYTKLGFRVIPDEEVTDRVREIVDGEKARCLDALSARVVMGIQLS